MNRRTSRSSTKLPGSSLGPFGLWFNRNETWAEQAGPWITYLARSSYLLQQGHYFADVAYFYGEEAPLTALFGTAPQKDAPQGYGFDFVNADVVLHQFTFKDDRLQTPGGTSYRLLYLGGTSRRMTLPVLRRIRDLVVAGAAVAGERPAESPSLADDPKAFRAIADELWGSELADRVRTVGKGRVYTGMGANDVLEDLKLERDFAYTKPKADTELMFLHRRLPDGDLYFVDNRRDRSENLTVTFRVAGKSPELWHADSGKTEPVSYLFHNGLTTIPLHLSANEAVFVVLRKSAAAAQKSYTRMTETSVANVEGPWTVSFQPGRGVLAPVTFDKLASWSESRDIGIRYFSGTATYEKTIDISSDWLKAGRELWLDLGEVQVIASVNLNGVEVGTAWKSPYRVPLGKAVRAGTNKLTIRVSNLWPNRMIGDLQPGNSVRYAFMTFEPYKVDSPLLPSGLLGPVTLFAQDPP